MSIAENAGAVKVTLPDGSQRELPRGATVLSVAEAIGPRLAKAALAARVDGQVVDLTRPIEHDAKVEILTEKNPEALDVLRHSAAHVLATAVRKVRPEARIGFGPSIADGFYYDFEVDRPFTPEDLQQIEREMEAVAKDDESFERRVVSRDEAREIFADDPLKLERLEELGPDETITIYRNGPFTDLCRGPHVPSTGRLKHFRLLNTAGAYWRGDEKRQMLQRIYGTAWFTKEDLEQYIHRLEEARKRDHRKLGRELDLFQFHPVSPGAAFWTPRGTTLYNTLVEFVRERQLRDFEEIKTPLLYNKALWEQSGHWGKYRENMFLVLDAESGEHDISLKPMNCPSHFIYYGSEKHSYRELPLRYVTFDVLHRNELSGALSGLTRVRQFQQDDCHVFMREDQITEEVRFLLGFILGYYETFGLTATLKFATRPEQRIGSDEMWDRAEAGLRAALEATGMPYELKEGDGAFYGPKIDFDVTDSIGRAWQLGTIQLDYSNPERFDLTYVGEDNLPHRPVVIHRAVSGSFERFIAILIEHFAGAFPVWLAPVQVVVIPISDDQAGVARQYGAELREMGIRVRVDDRNETLNYRIREAETQKVPYMAVIGGREAEGGTAAVRVRGAGRKQEVLDRRALADRILEQVRSRTLQVGFEAAEAAE
ncbi:threonine--tRNA ligase [Longimicrobium sp.]|uniref:threonine--tRNA ligase n=1 Tax=Longimicrobium sp. TaxID=2029185 RepID=UPI002BE9F434|nr:threonine--tRNA ligase [Longimicrobium sp.]HSU12459.1 threonine--tRNA ligase [Longimicrobium sp.]